MVPLNDNKPTETTAYVTYTLIGINIVVFWHEINLRSEELAQFFQYYAIVPKQLTAGFNGVDFSHPIPEWMTLITSQFLHGGFLHLAGNMLFLWIFGNNVEDKLGHVKYLFFY